MKLFALIIPLCIGCASAPIVQQAQPPEEMPELPECPTGEFRGVGIDEITAFSNLAKQINLSIKVTTERIINQQIHNGNEDLSVVYRDTALMGTELSNAHDARVVYNKHSSVVACMSKADAAKPYIRKQSLLLDSLELMAASGLKATHPRQKSEARNKANVIWARMLANNDLLESWGMESSISRAKDLHSAVEDDYKGYCQNMKVHWEDSKGECSDASFAMLSNKIKMEKSNCLKGLKLRFACTEKCKSVSYGVECSFEPSLAIESCEGNMYSMLNVKEPLTGSDMNNANRAKENLIENLKRASFFNEWEKEIKEWVPQCVD